MAGQTLDLGHALLGFRRHRGTLLTAAVVGAVLGMVYVFLRPPMYTSSSLVLLPNKAADPDQMAELVKTDVRIATSDSVLGPAARRLRPAVSPEDLSHDVDVTAVTPLVLEVKGHAAKPQRAEEISRAVADADVRYVTESASSVSSAGKALITDRADKMRASLDKVEEQIRKTAARQQGEDPRSDQGKADATALAKLTAEQGDMVIQLNSLRSQAEEIQPSGGASVIQTPSPARRAGLPGRYIAASMMGMLLAALLAAGAIALLTQRDRRLYFRDDIADAVGSPVIASVGTRSTSSVADWIALFREYTPGTIDAWAWRRALRQFGVTDFPAPTESKHKGHTEHPDSIAVITLSGDPRGLTAGPELAAYAASSGIRTHLVAAQRHETAAALWVACSSLEQDIQPRQYLSVDTGHHRQPPHRADLVVTLAVVDREEPKLLDLPARSVVVLALSAGSATAEELARVAVTVDETGERIQAIVVTDPDNLDRTTGRLLQHDRVRQIPLPMRSAGTPTPRAPHSPPDPQRRQG